MCHTGAVLFDTREEGFCFSSTPPYAMEAHGGQAAAMRYRWARIEPAFQGYAEGLRGARGVPRAAPTCPGLVWLPPGHGTVL